LAGMERIRAVAESLGRIKRNRFRLARWLFEKLLGAFLVSAFVLYGSLFGLQLHQSPFQSVYLVITSLSILAYVLSVLLIPSAKKKEEEPAERSV
jgi:Kef-type K+ transport system membrane component KefB